MIRLIRQLMLIAMLGAVSAGAFAQRKDQDKRPPKEPAKVDDQRPKDQRPPRQNTNQHLPKTTAADLTKPGPQTAQRKKATQDTKASEKLATSS